MLHTAKRGPVRLLMLLAVLQGGCLLESESVEEVGKCGPQDLTIECCLKRFPGQWERCTGSPDAAQAAEVVERAPSMAAKVVAAGMAGVVAAQGVHLHSAERRGTELAADLLTEIEREIVRCVRQADQYVNDHHFKGRSPSWELCQQVKVGDQTTWAAYLGLFKHEQAWPCLHEALKKLVPDRYRLRPRFYINPMTGKWEYMDPNLVSQIVTQEGWKGLKGTIEPDIILLDENGVVMHVYDLKFPCPNTNVAQWERYEEGRWKDELQGNVYKEILGVTPMLVSPREGVVPEIR
ncbi:MAG TPA: hypothetical protein VEY88_06170 [Archangium sp.]|nr:hypothetical protein [Archangium sp.]